MADKRTMKRKIKAAMVQFLAAHLDDLGQGKAGTSTFVDEIFDKARGYSLKEPSEAQIRRFRDVVFELHQEAFREYYE